MLKQQSGFTLIELIMVIVVLAALAVTAIPAYIDLEDEATIGAMDGIGGSLASGTAINFAACAAGSPGCLALANCTDTPTTLVGGALPAGYNITALALTAGTGSVTVCTLNSVAPVLATTFSAITP